MGKGRGGTRSFAAIALPESWAFEAMLVQSSLRLGRIVAPENLHLTLVFLGELPDRLLEEVHGAFERVSPPAFEIRAGGIGHFGARAPRAVHLAVRPDPPLMALQAKLEQAARRAGAEVPARRFVPHVTLARLKGRQEDAAPLAEWLGARGSVSLPPARITSFTLFASHLGPDGPDYEALADYPLGA